MPSWPASRRWFHSCMVSPTTSWPSARSMAATVEESTPPDMATAMVCLFFIFSKGCELRAITAIGLRLFIVKPTRDDGLARSWRLEAQLTTDHCRWRQLPQSCDRLSHQSHCEFHFFHRVLLTEAETNAGACPIWAHAHGGQHVRRLNRSRRTSGAGRDCQSLQIKRNHQR